MVQDNPSEDPSMEVESGLQDDKRIPVASMVENWKIWASGR